MGRISTEAVDTVLDSTRDKLKAQLADQTMTAAGIDATIETTKLEAKSYETDPQFYRILLLSLVVVLVIVVVGLIHLLNTNNTSADTLLAVATSILTGLIGLLAPSPLTK